MAWWFAGKGDKTLTSWEATKLFNIVIFPRRLNLRYCQFLSTFWTFSIFSLKFRIIVSSGSIESQTPSVLFLNSCHLKSFSGQRSSELLAFEPIHNTSVFLLLSLRPEVLLNFPITSSKASSVSREPSKIKVVSSTY